MTRHETLFVIAILLWALAALYWMTLFGAALAFGGAVVVVKAVKVQRQTGEMVPVFL